VSARCRTRRARRADRSVCPLGHGGVEPFADVLANEAAADPEPTDIDSNTVGILRRGSSVADAGGNAILSTDHRGRFTTLGVLDSVPSSLPFRADPVPTSVVRGSDGACYISQLVGFPFDPGVSPIWRLEPGQAPEEYASGLTNVTDLAFGPDGRLYAVEIAVSSRTCSPRTGFAFDKEAMYVSTGAVALAPARSRASR
jgi:hypothetical protein